MHLSPDPAEPNIEIETYIFIFSKHINEKKMTNAPYTYVYMLIFATTVYFHFTVQ